MLNSEGGGIAAFGLERRLRPDVSRHHRDSRLDQSGFSALIDRRRLPVSGADLRLGVVLGGCKDDKVLYSKTVNHVDQN